MIIIIGMIQVSNKNDEKSTFNNNDELIMKIFSNIIGLQIRKALEYSQYVLYKIRLKKLMHVIL